jgi:hypothetical protein
LLSIFAKLFLEFLDDSLELELLGFVNDLHVDDHAVPLYFCLAGLLRRVVDAKTLAAFRGAAGVGCFEFALEASNPADQLFVDPLSLVERGANPFIVFGDGVLRRNLLLH